MPLTYTLEAQTYRRAYVGLWIAAGVLFAVLQGFGQKLWAAGAFFLLGGGAVTLRAISDRTLFDERDESVHRAASALTIGLYGILSAVVFPTLVALDALGLYQWGPVAAGVGLSVAVLYVTYGAMTVYVGSRT